MFFLTPPLLPSVLGTMVAVFWVASQLALPTIVGLIIDRVVDGDMPGVGALAAGLGVAALVSSLTQSAFRYVFAWWGSTVTAGIRSLLARRMPDKRIEDLEQRQSGEITALYMESAPQIGGLFTSVLAGAVLSGCQLILNGSLILWRYGTTGTFAFLLIPFYVLLPMVLSKHARKASKDLQEHNAEVTARVQEAVESVREIKLFSAHAWLFDRLQILFVRTRNLAVRLLRVELFGELHYWLYWIAVSIIYWRGAHEVVAGNWTVGALVAFVSYLGMLEAPSRTLSMLGVLVQPGREATRRVFDFLDLADEEPAGEGAALPGRSPSSEELSSRARAIEFRDVTFTYRGADTPAISGLSFTVKPAQVAAIVGPSGAGKSTLAALLLRLYEPDSGDVLVGGESVRQWSLAKLRRCVAIVSQRPHLFKATVRENISFSGASPDTSLPEVERAAQLANATEFIQNLPEGYESDVGERGNRLSVGQSQRITIARTLHYDPEVLILDEATSSQDGESESSVRAAITELMRERTTLIITHRLSSVFDADVIFLLENGMLAAQGSHAELMASSPRYRRLVAKSGKSALEDEPAQSLAETRGGT